MERGEKAVTKRTTLEAMADALRVHPSELTGQPWTQQDARQTEAQAGLLKGLEVALERYELGVDPELPVRAWPQIQADIDRLVRLHHHVVDYPVAMGFRGRPLRLCGCAPRHWRTRRGWGVQQSRGVTPPVSSIGSGSTAARWLWRRH